jgi:hypothetical protein
MIGKNLTVMWIFARVTLRDDLTAQLLQNLLRRDTQGCVDCPGIFVLP